MVLPTYPRLGKETIINEPGHYKGYYCNYCPGQNTPFDFVPAPDWHVISCTHVGSGSHGCCPGCVVILIEIKHNNYGLEDPEPAPVTTSKDSKILCCVLLISAAAWLLSG